MCTQIPVFTNYNTQWLTNTMLGKTRFTVSAKACIGEYLYMVYGSNKLRGKTKTQWYPNG